MFPTATSAMARWVPRGQWGFAQGVTHAFARLGNALTPPLIAGLITFASWRAAFIVLGAASLVWVAAWAWFFRDDPRDHQGITAAEIEALPPARPACQGRPAVPWRRLIRRILPATAVDFCYGWTLWLFLSWIPSFFYGAYHLDLKNSALFAALVFGGGVLGDALGGWLSDAILRRTGSLVRARRDLVIAGMLGSLACSAPILFITDPVMAALSLGGAFFFAELTIGPMWAIPMDIAPAHSGTASGLMNTGSALAAILSPLAFGYIIDQTGNWSLPFWGTMGLLVVGVAAAFWMRPDRTFAADAALPRGAQTLAG